MSPLIHSFVECWWRTIRSVVIELKRHITRWIADPGRSRLGEDGRWFDEGGVNYYCIGLMLCILFVVWVLTFVLS